jgi:hypothetical protein
VSSFGQVASLLVRSRFPLGTFGDLDWTPPPLPRPRIEKQFSGGSETIIDPPTMIDPETGEVIEEMPYINMLNRTLPKDIRVLAWSPVDGNFDARFSCTYRRYKYFFPKAHLNIAKMQEAASYLLGKKKSKSNG